MDRSKGRDRHAVDALDPADLLEVLDGAAGLDEDGAHGLAATLGEVVEQVHAPAGVADERAEPASPLRGVAGQRDALGRGLRGSD